MNIFDLLSPAEWKCLAHIERRWLANSRQPVPARDLPGIDLLGDGLMLKGYLVKHTPETGVRWELTEGGRLRIQEAMDELAAHDALRLLNVPLQPAQAFPGPSLPEPGEAVVAVDFAVPVHATIGDRYPAWQDAVDAAQRTIRHHDYPGQAVKRTADDYHPKRHFAMDGGLRVYTRAFVHQRVRTITSDTVARTWEVFHDGSAEAMS